MAEPTPTNPKAAASDIPPATPLPVVARIPIASKVTIATRSSASAPPNALEISWSSEAFTNPQHLHLNAHIRVPTAILSTFTFIY